MATTMTKRFHTGQQCEQSGRYDFDGYMDGTQHPRPAARGASNPPVQDRDLPPDPFLRQGVLLEGDGADLIQVPTAMVANAAVVVSDWGEMDVSPTRVKPFQQSTRDGVRTFWARRRLPPT